MREKEAIGARAVALIHHPDCLKHSSGPDHPERPERVQAILRHLGERRLLERLLEVESSPCPLEALATVHLESYIETVRQACERAPARLDPDTSVSSGSWEAALSAAGAAIAACDAVMTGRARAAFSACRPPGHHAEADRAMGFCLFNNVAVAARHLQRAHGLGRVLIVDWDVHHGNGTQHIFEADDTVFYFSTHQFPLYPGTGRMDERGRGPGTGFTLNIPLPANTDDADYLRIYEEVLTPAIERFRPQAILISAGFDAHRDDPLAGMTVTEEGYAAMSNVLREAAEKHCDGRIISLLEGGYNLAALASSVEAHLVALGA